MFGKRLHSNRNSSSNSNSHSHGNGNGNNNVDDDCNGNGDIDGKDGDSDSDSKNISNRDRHSRRDSDSHNDSDSNGYGNCNGNDNNDGNGSSDSHSNGNRSLKDVTITASPAIRVGDTLRLECNYDLENALLYSIKWYFGDDEFYRYVPKEAPPTRVFPMDGVSVDISQSDTRAVSLRNIQRNRTGFYACEVSADAPSFHTEIRKTLVIVVEVPLGNLTLKTYKNRNSNNELTSISATCIAPKSYPAVNLTWFIHGLQVQNDASKKITTSIVSDVDSLESTQSEIEIHNPSSTGVFIDGKLFLTCEATQFSVYKQSRNATIQDDSPHISPVVLQTAAPARCSGISSKIIVILCSSLMVVLLDR